MATSAKNIGLSPASMQLGLGDALKQQIQDQDEERKKALLKQSQALQSSAANALLGASNA